jgi:hypothetical protein
MIEMKQLGKVGDISSEEFLSKYKNTQTPVIMKNITKEWPAKEKWSLEYFESLGGDNEVKLYDSKPSTDYKLQHAAETTMPLRKYFEILKRGENDLRIFFFDMLREIPSLKNDFSFPKIGLHWFKKLPVMFIAGNRAKVQMHFDIDYADIFLCHFGGKKKVILFSPDQTPYMYHVPFSFSAYHDVDFENPDYEKYPALKFLKGEEAILEHGDVLYIPPGWWHYIIYEEIGYSMAIRSFPRDLKNVAKMLRNLVWIRSVDGIMRMFLGQKWNDRNTKVALQRTNNLAQEKGA